MKANEIRLGNLVTYDGRVFEIDTIAKEFPTLNTIEFGIGVVDWMNINSIPLTEEWLIKFGFGDARITNRLYTRKKTDGFYGFYINKETMSYCTFDYEGTIDDIIKIEYVHQLQNLYFAVTGEELTMK
jgi:hypothetical protein